MEGTRSLVVATVAAEKLQRGERLEHELIGGGNLCLTGRGPNNLEVFSEPVRVESCLVHGSVMLENCHFHQVVSFRHSTLFRVEIRDCIFDQGLVLGDVSANFIKLVKVKAKVLDLTKSHITGMLDIDRKTIVERLMLEQLVSRNTNIHLHIIENGQTLNLRSAELAMS